MSLAIAGSVSLTSCAVEPAKDLDQFESIDLGSSPAPVPTKTFDSDGQQYATDPSAEVDIDDQSGSGS